MNHHKILFTCILLTTTFIYLSNSTTTAPQVIPVKDPNNIKLTFGSCNAILGHEQNEIFNRIAEFKSDVWIWLGDVAYLDIEGFPPKFQFPGEARAREKFNIIKNDRNYKNLRDSTPVIGVWDDHDYGRDNSGKTFPFKNLSRELWLDFIDEPKESLRRTRKGGIYESYYLGDPSKVKIILVDGRFSRDDYSLMKSDTIDLLGAEQWEWLESELKENQAEYIVIGSGVQVFPDDRLLPETWYKQSREKLLSLIRKYKVNGVVLLSGDVHYAEIMKYPCKQKVGYELYEFTSSGLTHHASSHVPIIAGLFSQLFPKTYNDVEDKYFERNFGVVEFSFGETKKVKLEARNYYGQPVLTKEISKSELQFDASTLDENAYCVADTNRFARFFTHLGKALLQGKIYIWAVVLIIAFVLVFLITIIKFILGVLWWIIRTIFGIRKTTRTKAPKEKQN